MKIDLFPSVRLSPPLRKALSTFSASPHGTSEESFYPPSLLSMKISSLFLHPLFLRGVVTPLLLLRESQPFSP